MLKNVFVALALLCAAASAASAQLPAPPVTTGGRCIGVMSIVGHTFQLRKVGIMVFGNEEQNVPVNWSGIDDLFVSRITAYLGRQLSVRRLHYSKSAVAAWEAPGEYNPFRRRDNELKDIVRTAAASHRCDHHVVVLRAAQKVVGDQLVTGLGILQQGVPVTNTTTVYALAAIHVLDGKTFDYLRQTRVSRDDLVVSLFTGGGMSRKVDPSWWPDPSQVSQNAKLRDAVRALLEPALNAALPRAFPPAGS